MRLTLLAASACLLGTNVAYGQIVKQHVQKIGNQVITEVEVVKPPPPVEGKVDGGASATATVLGVRNWRNGGTIFDDEMGRVWRLINGLPVRDQPKHLSGWRLVPLDGEPRFFTVTGRLFLRQ